MIATNKSDNIILPRTPLVSIITINYNNLAGLQNTVKSVQAQTYRNFEHIVVDGNSQDGSIEFIQDNKDCFSKLLIEKDDGIYDAMNKGLPHCSGSFLLFLNSGDCFYHKHNLQQFVNSIIELDCIYFGRAKIQHNELNWNFPPDNITSTKIDTWLHHKAPNHQATYFPYSYYKNNRFDQNFKIVGDVDYIMRGIYAYGYTFIDAVLVEFELGGISSSSNSINSVNRQILESLLVHKRYFRRKLFCLFYVPFRFYLKFILRTLATKNYFKLLRAINVLKN